MTSLGILIAAVIAVVVGYTILFVPCGPHQDECGHGVEPEYCPDCQRFELTDWYSTSPGTSAPRFDKTEGEN